MQTDLARYLPSYYDGVKETDVLMDVENQLFDDLKDKSKLTLDNQFILTCDENMLALWEGILQITFNPETDSINFRRQRIINRLASRSAFTIWFLKERLDDLLGRGGYEIVVNHKDYELIVETAVDNQAIFNEMIITVHRIKPANIVFRLMPVLRNQLEIKTQAFASRIDYKRAGHWVVGETPIEAVGKEREVRLHVD